MTRITTEDCERVVPNRFELVLLAAQRAREYARVSVLPDAVGYDGVTVTALREMAAGRIWLHHLRASQVRRVLGPLLAIRTTTPITSERYTLADLGSSHSTLNHHWEAAEDWSAHADALEAAEPSSHEFLLALSVERHRSWPRWASEMQEFSAADPAATEFPAGSPPHPGRSGREVPATGEQSNLA